jgi:pantoate--beta-alanine ligase
MNVFETPDDVRAWSDDARRNARVVALVPTMGALHDGHLALIDEARRHGDAVAVSIFVNPLQFNVAADFAGYPRPLDDDLAICARAGVDAVYVPTAATMYPAGFQTHVEPGPLADQFEGEHRPGHFRGVVTVVSKLFSATRPDVAVFGQKDAQQLAIIRRMNVDLDHGVDIVALPTVREHDGLALSSRNRRLDPDQRRAAVCLWHGLLAGARLAASGEQRAPEVEAAVAATISAEPAARLEYVAVVDSSTFERDGSTAGSKLIVVAAWMGDIRLIDNMPIDNAGPSA